MMNVSYSLRFAFVLALYSLTTTCYSKVLHQATQGFTIEIIAVVPASADDSYQQFLKVGEWWDGEHSWFGDAQNFLLEPRAGGCFCEVSGDRQVQHMTVSYVDPGKEVKLLGGLGPLQMMAVSGAMSWKFEALEANKTQIIHTYTVSGYAYGGLDKLAPIVDEVQAGQVVRLAEKLGG